MHSKSLKVGAFQFSPSSDIDENLHCIKRGIEEAASQNVRLLLTQECAVCGYPPVEIESIDSIDRIQQEKAVQEIRKLAEKHDMYIALGMITFSDEGTFNSVQLISPNEKRYNRYHKRALWGWDTDNFIPGDEPGIYSIDGVKIGIRICFEVRFPEYFRELFADEVDLCLVSFTDIGPKEQKNKIDVIQSHLVSRAAENVMYLLSANSISQHQLAPTCLINPDGYVIERAPLNKESLIVREIDFMSPDFGQEGRIKHTGQLSYYSRKV
ncbi:carbon-nitrogen hydrolase family protein [Spirochaeta isovalerica]|uniref:Putative amidohydrolase n=1 Tax=Spirochaeta isovalerica TaxID=150 RepID=A0A841RCR5_9SPIO|nr:carbon-nitrogen hydrolase family protein [Spirochaeta isovalerica]MBB6480448.1 putative amidohydrolase [Spirochaeta isovalerica]